MTRRLVAIVGPTAAGKTALAAELAHRLPGEIVGADSRQVYRHMDIGTAKPTDGERAAAPHHLIDVVYPDEPFSLGRWLDLALEALDGIWSRGKQPFLVGGTGQYVWALLEGWQVPRVPPQRELRRELEVQPVSALIEELRRADPESAAQIDPRNARRVIRALEVYRVTGKPLSYWRTKAPPSFQTLVIGLRMPREELHRRTDSRVDRMMDGGLISEVQRLLAMGYGRELPSMSGIGYREICQYLAAEMDLIEATTRIKMGTHRLARHQSSWFKPDDPRIRWIEAGESAAEAATRLVVEWLGAVGPAERRAAKVIR